MLSVRKLLFSQLFTRFGKRFFLSDAYFCYDKWDESLKADIMKVDFNELVDKIEDNLNKKLRVTSLDMDILAAKTTYATHVEDLERVESLFRKFRQTSPARNSTESLSHSFIRSYMDLDHSSRLIEILKNKLEYGIFVDDYTGNMLMDTFFKSEKFEDAMRIAAEFMLQEECRNPIARSFSVYSCLKFLDSVSLDDLYRSDVADQSEDKEEPEYVKVRYIPNKIYDDHFDINITRKLLGKTLYFFGNTENTPTSDSLRVIGSALHGKFEKCLEVLKNHKANLSTVALDIVLHSIENYNDEEEKKLPYYPLPKSRQKPRPVQEIFSDIKEVMSKWRPGNSTNDVLNLAEAAEQRLLSNVKSHEEQDINAQISLIDKWQKERNEEFESQIKRYQLEEKKKALLKEIDELEKQEEILTFFDNYSNIVMHYADGKFKEEDPQTVEVEGEKKFNEDFRKYYKLQRYDPIVYYKHRRGPRYKPPLFRVGVVDYDTIERSNVVEKN